MLKNLSTAVRMSWARSKQTDSLPFGQQLKEMLMLQLMTGFGPGNYHKYRLWQKDMPWQQKLGYWHDQKYYRFLNQVNPLEYRMLARNKIVAKSLLSFYSIPDAQYLGYLSGSGRFIPNGSVPDCARDLTSILRSYPDIERICFKPVEGSGGDGFCAADVIRGDDISLRELGEHKSLSVDAFIERTLTPYTGCDFIIEVYLEQHPTLAAFNPSSLNTLRVWVGKDQGSEASVIAVYLRVGRAGSLVDNRLSGGFGIAIDQNNFKTTIAVPQDSSGPSFKHHPDSGYDMSERQLPFQKEVIALAKKVTNVLPSTRFVGLDIALTPDGPVIIEFNLAPTAIGACVMNRSHQQLLGTLVH